MADQEAPSHALPDVAGHSFVLLPVGPARLDAVVRMIGEAKASVRLLFYIFIDDASGRRVRDALLAAHRRGVAVSLLVDGFGSKDTPDEFFAPLDGSDAYFCRYEPTRGRRYLLRNHQKLVIADEKRAIVGGFNIEDCYFAERGDPKGWRDLGLALEGPAATRLAAYFDALAEWAQRKRSKVKEVRRFLYRFTEQDGDVRWLLGGPTNDLSPWANSLRLALARASRADIVAAYFAPYWAFLRLLRGVAERGSARVITASRSDNNATIAAARNRYQYLLPGVRIYEYQPMMLHTKLYVVDDTVYLGSANFDTRSLYLNLELMIRVRDAGFAAAMRRYVDGEAADSDEITPEEYAASQTLWTRIKGRLSYLLISVLDYNISRRLNFGIDGD
ncbi:MAG: phosphatidylserine/phosphatidylglycerophosphate/cardiolipin synthase family protein [Sphingomonadaceae bacterium]|nr:phosphatidylserine/phosphatidylglycerophosphate/cardiolipin synthase family protein [Sphingomonadaceae bacterium]